jgi:hypothetical protein
MQYLTTKDKTVSDEYATRTELNGIGSRITNVEIRQAECSAGLSQRVKSLESWTDDQEDKLDTLKTEYVRIEIESKDRDGKLENKMVTLKEEIVKAIAGRVVLYGVLVVITVAFIQVISNVVGN